MLKLIKNTVKNWHGNDPYTHSAAIAYYTIFSFPALIIILMSMIDFFIDQKVLETSIISYLDDIIGPEAAVETFQTVDRVSLNDSSTLVFMLSATMLLFTSLRLFMQLQLALNNIWNVKSKEFSWGSLLMRRAYSFGLMASIGFTLLVSLMVTSVLTSLSDWMSANIPDYLQVLIFAVNFTFSLSVTTFLFTLIIKILPDKHIDWKIAIRGGAASAVLFLFGQYALGIYFDLVEPQSAYGVSGSVILLMLWVSYSSMILLFGAEFAKAYLEKKNEA